MDPQRPFFPEHPGEMTQHQPSIAPSSPASERTLFHPPPNHPSRSLSTAAPQALYSPPVELPQTPDTTRSTVPTFTSNDTSNYNISYSNPPPIPESYVESNRDPEKSFPTFVQTVPNNHYSTPVVPVSHAVADNRRKKILGVEMTNTFLVCLALVLIIIAALFGGLAGGGVFEPKRNNPDSMPENVYDTHTTTIYTTTSDIAIITSSPTTTTTTTTTATTTSTTAAGTQADWVYPIATGVWNLDGNLALDNGTCISNKTSPTETAVWYCDQKELLTVTIKGGGDPKDYAYWLDIDAPVRRRGIQGKPPTITQQDVKDGKVGSIWWAFEVPYKTQAFPDVDGCEVEVSLTVLLGENWSDWALIEYVSSPNECVLPNGKNSTAGLWCQCGYLDEDLKFRIRRSGYGLYKRYFEFL